jgi:hypothetical protein
MARVGSSVDRDLDVPVVGIAATDGDVPAVTLQATGEREVDEQVGAAHLGNPLGNRRERARQVGRTARHVEPAVTPRREPLAQHVLAVVELVGPQVVVGCHLGHGVWL